MIEQTQTPTGNPPQKILTTAEVCALRRCHRTTLWRDVRDKRFPAPLTIGPNRRGWLQSDYDDWLAKMVAKRNAR